MESVLGSFRWPVKNATHETSDVRKMSKIPLINSRVVGKKTVPLSSSHLPSTQQRWTNSADPWCLFWEDMRESRCSSLVAPLLEVERLVCVQEPDSSALNPQSLTEICTVRNCLSGAGEKYSLLSMVPLFFFNFFFDQPLLLQASAFMQLTQYDRPYSVVVWLALEVTPGNPFERLFLVHNLVYRTIRVVPTHVQRASPAVWILPEDANIEGGRAPAKSDQP